jgi:tetratricopeptide (TPR) repeat protein
MATETELPDRRERRSTDQIDRKHWWDTASRWWTFVIKGVLGLAAILTFAVITNLFYEALFKRSIIIEPISVPKDMEANGYTPDVAALHLLDAMNKYAEHARTSGAGPKLALHMDPADFVLPSVGLSFKAVVAQIRRFVPIGGGQNISGDITRVDGKLRLRLLKNEVVIRESSEGANEKDLKALKTLFDDAALGVFAATRRYFEAVVNSEKNPEVAFELAKRIIADRPSGEDVVWAHNLLGLLLHRRGKLDEKADGAVAEFKRMIHYPSFRGHDPRLAIAHLNLGLAYKEQGDAKSAINEFRSAISIRPELGTAHLKLGDVLDQTGEAETAGCEYLEAIAKFYQDVVPDPFSAVAHQRLGDALKNKEKADKANCAFQGKSILRDIGRYDNAVAEYQRAAERDPYDAHIRYDLASELLESPDQVDKAIDKLQEALDIRKTRNDSFDEFQDQLLKTLSKAIRIKGGNDDEVKIINVKHIFTSASGMRSARNAKPSSG